MLSFNTGVRIYLRRYRKTLERVRNHSPELQKKELDNIFKSSSLESRDIKSKFYHSKPTTYLDYQVDIDNRFKNKNGKFKDVSKFAKTAGTSGSTSKLIPTSDHFLKRNHVSAGWLTMSLMYTLRPDMDIISKKNLLVGGAIYEENEDYTIADISGLLIKRIPKLFHSYYVPTISEATIPDWEQKLEITAKRAAKTNEIVMLAGVPTWILTLVKEVLKISGKTTLSEVWPELKVYLHGGVRFEPFREQFDMLFSNSINKVLYLEVYNASEGFFAVQDTWSNNGMLLLTEHGIYYEFIPINDYKLGFYNIMSLEDVETDEEYVILITNISGLRRYIIGDTVVFTSVSPYRLKVMGRISEYINAFGEDLSLENVNNAITHTCNKHKAYIRDFTVAPYYISLDTKGFHQWFIEFEIPPIDLNGFTSDLDVELQDLNFNYRQKRSDDLAMSCLEVVSLPTGFYDKYAKSKNKFGGQNKLPKLRNDRYLADDIASALRTYFSELNEFS